MEFPGTKKTSNMELPRRYIKPSEPPDLTSLHT